MKKFLVLLLCIGFVSSVFAQADLFTVVSSKNVVIKKGSSWANLNVGEKLKANDLIKSNSGGIASLLHSSGKVVKFTESKETVVSSFEKSLKPANQSGGLAGELLNSNLNKMNRSSSFTAGNVGATRATESISKDIFLITPRKENNNPSKILDQYPLFVRNNVQDEKEYQLIILTDGLTTVKNLVVKDTSYKYPKDDPTKLEKGATYVCMVRPMKSQKNSEYQTFTIASDSEVKIMKAKIEFAESMVTDADEVAKCVIRATTFEDLGLYSDAYFSYQKAIKLDPNEKAYKKMLADLLWKVNLIKQTYYLTGIKFDTK
jgi:hypothetical protein